MKKIKPIVKFNGGRGAIICNTCRVIVRVDLTEQEWSRPHVLFCEEHNKAYLNKTEEPTWVCGECAEERGASVPEGHCYTVHAGVCGICNMERTVTEPRDYGLTRSLLRIKMK